MLTSVEGGGSNRFGNQKHNSKAAALIPGINIQSKLIQISMQQCFDRNAKTNSFL
jgi:hypothetical protein